MSMFAGVMCKSVMRPGLSPTEASERFEALDCLRGFALLGIALANFPEFSLYTFLPSDAAAAMPTAKADGVLRWLLLMLVDGKFYTLFSLLFGLGFSLMMGKAGRGGRGGAWLFVRRMLWLAAIGALHLMMLWSGDILLLYAVLGLALPMLRGMSGRGLGVLAIVLLGLPVAVDGVQEALGASLSEPLARRQWSWCGRFGITEEGFAYWLRDAKGYGGVLEFLVQGAWERMYEFVEGNRYFKVLGLFVLGYWAGRERLYARLGELRGRLARLACAGAAVSLPLSALYAWSAAGGHPWGKTVHTLLYTLSVYPLGLTYALALCVAYAGRPRLRLWRWLAAPGRMALTNYIGHTVAGMLLFYGIGLGLGAGVGLVETEAIALAVYAFLAALSSWWLKAFRYGPLEWLWRMLTYGKALPLRKA